MRPAEIHMPVFESRDKRAVKLSFEMLRAQLMGLAAANVYYLLTFPKTPKLYESGVVYKPENQTEQWLTIPYVLKQGFGDCEDLAAWRAAEYVVPIINANPGILKRVTVEQILRQFALPDIRARLIGNVWRAHAFVRLPNGTLDDPSLKLGMKGID